MMSEKLDVNLLIMMSHCTYKLPSFQEDLFEESGSTELSMHCASG